MTKDEMKNLFIEDGIELTDNLNEAKEWYKKVLNNKWLDGTEEQYKELFD